MLDIPLVNIINSIDGAVVLKLSQSFPKYSPGEDVDLLVLDLNGAIESVCVYFSQCLQDVAELKINQEDDHCHIDFFDNGKLDIRIDLITRFDYYNKLSVKNSFVSKIFRDCKKCVYNGNIYYIPCEEDELTMRYFEYIEYFSISPDKIKHINYISDVKDENIKNKFFDNTHKYIEFKRMRWDASSSNNGVFTSIISNREALINIRYSLRFLVVNTFKLLVAKIFGRYI